MASQQYWARSHSAGWAPEEEYLVPYWHHHAGGRGAPGGSHRHHAALIFPTSDNREDGADVHVEGWWDHPVAEGRAAHANNPTGRSDNKFH